MSNDILRELESVLAQRRNADPETSYVASLLAKGLNKVLEKVGEEATEVILAAKDTENGADPKLLIGEVADLWFHSMVALSHLGLSHQDVLAELEKRFGLSGIEEKASRKS